MSSLEQDDQNALCPRQADQYITAILKREATGKGKEARNIKLIRVNIQKKCDLLHIKILLSRRAAISCCPVSHKISCGLSWRQKVKDLPKTVANSILLSQLSEMDVCGELG